MELVQSVQEHKYFGIESGGQIADTDTAAYAGGVWGTISSTFNISNISSINLRHNISLKKNISTEIKIIDQIRDYKLAWSLILTINYEDDLVFIKEETLNIWCEGDTLEEVLEDFEDFFLYDFESYKNMPEGKMDVSARNALKLYQALLKKS